MRKMRGLWILGAVLGIMVSSSVGRTLRVPQDYGTIRAAVDAARANDTILVAEGTYSDTGNINIRLSVPLTITSTRGPLRTIIDGNFNVSGARGFTLTSGCRIIGFTFTRMNQPVILDSAANNVLIKDVIITNCRSGDNQINVGIRVHSSTNVRLENILFRDIHSRASGGALYIGYNSRAVVVNCIFDGNRSQRYGGGVLVTNNTQADFFNCLFVSNQADSSGGALGFSVSASGTISFCTIVNNQTAGQTSMGGGLYKGSNSNPTVINSIFWGNSSANGPSMFGENNGGTITVSYTDLQWRNQLGQANVGQGVFEEPPVFAQGREMIYGGLNFFYLDQEDSPCINAGSGDARDLGVDTMFTSPNFQLDQGRADLGFHYSFGLFYRVGLLRGYVFDAQTERTIPGALISTSRFRSTTTDHRGYWVLPEHDIGRFWIRCSAEGYLDSLLEDLELRENDTLTIDFHLLHPEFILSLNEVRMEVDSGSQGSTSFNLHNAGNGPLTWRAEKRLTGEADRFPWDQRRIYDAGNLLDDDRLQGVVLIDTVFYIAGANGNDPNMFYTMSTRGAVLDSFPQFGSSQYGMRDMEYDPEEMLIWGTDNDTLFGFTRDGMVFRMFPTRNVRSATNVAFDQHNGLIWISATTSNIFAFDREGNVVDTLNRKGFRIYGLAWWPDPQGYNLYILNRPGGTLNLIYKMNIETNDTILVATIPLDVGDLTAAAFSSDYDLYSVVFLSIINLPRNNGNDKVGVWQFQANTSWILLEPMEGVLGPDEFTEFNLTLNPVGFPIGVHRAQIHFLHNAFGGELFLPITLRIRPPNQVGERSQPPLPLRFGWKGAYPNPFNSSTLLTFALDRPGVVRISLFDMLGREVREVTEVWMDQGNQRLELNASDLPTGIYLIKLSQQGRSSIMKLALVR